MGRELCGGSSRQHRGLGFRVGVPCASGTRKWGGIRAGPKTPTFIYIDHFAQLQLSFGGLSEHPGFLDYLLKHLKSGCLAKNSKKGEFWVVDGWQDGRATTFPWLSTPEAHRRLSHCFLLPGLRVVNGWRCD